MPACANRYFILNKPRGMVSQFISSHDVPLLGDVDFDFPEGTHAIGRLDKDSEGLLILTTDNTVTRKLFLSSTPHHRCYLVMVQNVISPETLLILEKGVSIKIKNGEVYIAKPAFVKLINDPLQLYKYAADDREKYPHSWLLIGLTEGKFHQVRKMVLALRHRCLRLIRISISGLSLNDLKPGEVKEVNAEKFERMLLRSKK